MKCLDTGTLQAYLDQELPEAWRRPIADHVAECETCRARFERLESASLQVRGWLDALAPEGANVHGAVPAFASRRSGQSWLWVAAACAAAVALALIPANRSPAPQRQVVRVIQPHAVPSAPPGPLPVLRAAVKRERVRPQRRMPATEEFVPLDDADPIQIGMVVRMTLPVWVGDGMREVAADVAIGEDGRARAIRFVR